MELFSLSLSLLRLKDKIRSSVLEDRSPKSRENYYSIFHQSRKIRGSINSSMNSLISGGLIEWEWEGGVALPQMTGGDNACGSLVPQRSRTKTKKEFSQVVYILI